MLNKILDYYNSCESTEDAILDDFFSGEILRRLDSSEGRPDLKNKLLEFKVAFEEGTSLQSSLVAMIMAILSGEKLFDDNISADVKKEFDNLNRFLSFFPESLIMSKDEDLEHIRDLENKNHSLEEDLGKSQRRIADLNEEIAKLKEEVDRLKQINSSKEVVKDVLGSVINAVLAGNPGTIGIKTPHAVSDHCDFEEDGVASKFKMIYVEGGTFAMGTTPEKGYSSNSDEQPAHEVTLSSFYIGETLVTQALWREVMGNNPSCFKGETGPVAGMSWNNCQEFIKRLNARTGKNFRLLTEAEWEYAARGGNKSNHTQYSGSGSIDEIAWYHGNSGKGTHPVKQKKSNELGLFDMSGNVWEWCYDWYDSSYYEKSPNNNPKGPTNGYNRVCRGGCWSTDASSCRVSCRGTWSPDKSGRSLGFRLALSE